MTEQDPDKLAAARTFFAAIPHSQVLGLEVEAVDAQSVTASVRYREELVGNPYSGHIHGGVVTTLIDQTSGTAAIISLDRFEPVATLDLRVDHLRPAEGRRPLYAHAECYRVTRNIAFVRCVAYQDDPEQPIATSMSSFMRTARRPEEERT